jgi:hypothetical protein
MTRNNINHSIHSTTNAQEPTPYEKSLQKEVIEAEKRFWAKCELRFKEGADEKGCPPNSIRTNIPRHDTFNPANKFTNRRKRKTSTKLPQGKCHSTEGGLKSYDQFDLIN